MQKKGILVVSFGTSYKDIWDKTFGAIEDRIQNAFSDYKLYRAFTSKIIMKKLKKEGVSICNVKEALQQMIEDGVADEIIIQPTHIINGIEYEEMCEDIQEFQDKFKKIHIGKPLLSDTNDYKELAKIMREAFPVEANEALVLMGHGSTHHANSVYPAFEYVLRDLDMDTIFVGTVEGYPELSEVKKQLEKKQIKKVCLAPMMIVAGDHANNDMIGDEDSWKVDLEQEGYEVRYYLTGLGEIEDVRNMFVCHAKDAISD